MQFKATQPRGDSYRKQTVWVKFTLALYGHVLCISAQEARDLSDPSKNKPPFALLLFQNTSDPTSQSIALVDRNKLASAEFLSIWSDLSPKVL